MPTLPDSPRDIGLDYAEYRPAQRAMAQHVLDVLDPATPTTTTAATKPKPTFAQAPTGVGKSLAVASIAHHHQTLVLVGTRGLGEQYARELGFAFVAGSDAYPCVLKSKVDSWRAKGKVPTAHDCHFSPKTNCPAAHACPYVIARERARLANAAVVTYAYISVSQTMQRRPGVLVCDEAHSMVDLLLSFTEFECDESTRRAWGLPDFPYSSASYGQGGRGDILTSIARGYVTDWLEGAKYIVHGETGDDSEHAAHAQRFYNKLNRLSEDIGLGEWFMRSGPTALTEYDYRTGRELPIPGIFLKGLTPRSVAPRLWSNKSTTLLMSATIGRTPTAIASELGIDDYNFLDYPHPVPVEYRPIYDLGVDKLTHANVTAHPHLPQAQANRIAAYIRSRDPRWRGIVLTTSHKRVEFLRAALGKHMPDRIYNPPTRRTGGREGTQVRIAGFLRDTRPGLIAVDTLAGWGSGLDLRGDLGRFSIVAGVEYPYTHDQYNIARRSRVGGRKWEDHQAFNGAMQAAGRAQRGEIDDDGNYIVSEAVLADGMATSSKAMSEYSEWFAGAITPSWNS